ncbi:hypothetical protein [Eisenbergiella porci]|uniref:hypothetical protein n=1 Tax=Eisenbergiella porci TaxID=2652274 RepID=UPI002ED171A0
MQKEKRTENKAVLEVAGRDQQDQRLFLNFNREQCVWELTKSETELWKEPVDSVLESLTRIVTNEAPEWSGSASELLQLLPEIDMQPNVFTRKLNVSLERLLIDYNIKYEFDIIRKRKFSMKLLCSVSVCSLQNSLTMYLFKSCSIL